MTVKRITNDILRVTGFRSTVIKLIFLTFIESQVLKEVQLYTVCVCCLMLFIGGHFLFCITD